MHPSPGASLASLAPSSFGRFSMALHDHSTTDLTALQDDVFRCIICFRHLDSSTIKSCQNCSKWYHTQCIEKWVRRNRSCPNCRIEAQQDVFVAINLEKTLGPAPMTLPRQISHDSSKSGSNEQIFNTVVHMSPPSSTNSLNMMAEPWSLQRRGHFVQVSHRWIVALLPRPTYTLAVSRDGNCTAVSKKSTFLWSTDILIEGGPLTYVWHAAVDERRGWLLFNFHNVLDVLCRLNVDVYYVEIDALEKTNNSRASKAKTKPLLKHRFNCLGLRVDPVLDLLVCTDWYNGKIGIWKIGELSTNSTIQPKHIINKPHELGSFSPTRCAIHRPNSSDPNVLQLAISDWLNDAVYLFRVEIQGDSSISSRYEATLATKGTRPGRVSGPVDLQFDSSGTLIVGDQRNKRLQVFIANPELPLFDVKVSDHVKAMFSAVAITEGLTLETKDGQSVAAAAQSKHIMVGLNNGEVHYFKVNS